MARARRRSGRAHRDGVRQGGTPAAAPPAPAAAGPLAGVCPDPVVVQTDWFPEAEYGAYFQMLGEQPTVRLERQEGDGPARRRRHAHRRRARDPLRRPGDRLPAGQRPAVRGQGDHARAGVHRRGDPELRRAAHGRRRGTAGDQPADDHVGPGEAPRRPHDRRPRPDGRAGALLPDRHLHAVPAGAGPAAPRSRSTAATTAARRAGSPPAATSPRRASPRPSPTSTRTSWARAAATTSSCS